jgi:sortase A
VLAGHRDSFFRPLRNIRTGDEITLTVGGGDAIYDVEWTSIVSPSALWVMQPTDANTLTLVTCYPFSFVGAAPNRFIVRARRRGVSGPVNVSLNSRR